MYHSIRIRFKRPKYRDTYFALQFDEKMLGLRYVNTTVCVVRGGLKRDFPRVNMEQNGHIWRILATLWEAR